MERDFYSLPRHWAQIGTHGLPWLGPIVASLPGCQRRAQLALGGESGGKGQSSPCTAAVQRRRGPGGLQRGPTRLGDVTPYVTVFLIIITSI
jgi:hypothetical protein